MDVAINYQESNVFSSYGKLNRPVRNNSPLTTDPIHRSSLLQRWTRTSERAKRGRLFRDVGISSSGQLSAFFHLDQLATRKVDRPAIKGSSCHSSGTWGRVAITVHRDRRDQISDPHAVCHSLPSNCLSLEGTAMFMSATVFVMPMAEI